MRARALVIHLMLIDNLYDIRYHDVSCRFTDTQQGKGVCDDNCIGRVSGTVGKWPAVEGLD